MTNATPRRAALLGALLIVLLTGCRAAPPHPRGPLTSGDVLRVARLLAVKIQKRSRQGWPESVVMDGRLPLLKVGACENRSDADLDGPALLARLAWELEQIQVVLVDPARATLILDVKVDPQLDAGRELLTVSAFVSGGGSTIGAGTELER